MIRVERVITPAWIHAQHNESTDRGVKKLQSTENIDAVIFDPEEKKDQAFKQQENANDPEQESLPEKPGKGAAQKGISVEPHHIDITA